MNLGLGAQVSLQRLDTPALEFLLDLRLDLLKRRRLGIADVVESNDMPAEVALDRGLGGLTLLELHHRFSERLHKG